MTGGKRKGDSGAAAAAAPATDAAPAGEKKKVKAQPQAQQQQQKSSLYVPPHQRGEGNVKPPFSSVIFLRVVLRSLCPTLSVRTRVVDSKL